MPKPLICIFPVPPSRGNARGSGFKAYSQQQKYFSKCNALVVKTSHTDSLEFIKFPIEKSAWTAKFEVKQLMDFDNMVAKLKWPIDWLKIRGMIVDDGPNHFWPRELPSQVKVGGKGCKEQLTITIYL